MGSGTGACRRSRVHRRLCHRDHSVFARLDFHGQRRIDLRNRRRNPRGLERRDHWRNPRLSDRALCPSAKHRRDSQGSPRFAAIDEAIGRNGWKIVGLLRLSPLIPFNLSNYFYGITSVRFGAYVLVSAVGMIPGTLLYAYLGAVGQAGVSGRASAHSNWQYSFARRGIDRDHRGHDFCQSNCKEGPEEISRRLIWRLRTLAAPE